MLIDPVLVKVDYMRRSLRPAFDTTRDAELIDDIRQHGVIEPLLVLENYMLVHGHRRLDVALYLKLAKIPVQVLDREDTPDLHQSMLIGKQASVYATVVTRAERIEALIVKTDLTKAYQGNIEKQNECEQAWIRLELATGYGRENLMAGLKLLKDMAKLEAGDKREQWEYARRVISAFRNYGLHPALRMAEQKTPALTNELDCGTFEQ